ncbi:cyclin-dependent kinase 4 [Ischnura elegans]|uniref:cyclin-dependent kinase 4 n=1 Tax=Ischnura elegans TaxID=197161 RepID=UPI001ED874EB|nr:cyclin-dependent kinase 4 [Ischnura elegans]XP_046403711.1 cyclin-dependent kinase 4 [Ischnura elegans]
MMPGSSAAAAEVPSLHPGKYEEVSVIGTGAYGTVYKAKDLLNPGVMVALKKVRVPLTEDGVPMSTLREIALLKQLDQHEHPNIVRLLDICHGQQNEKDQLLTLFLVFEHVDQDLSSYIEKCPAPGFSEEQVKDLMRQVLSGVDFLHSHRIVHRDLKPQNLLVTSGGRVKLADFGLAKTYDFEMRLTSVVVTLWYRAPEVLLGLPYATPVDIWSCGCIMAELFRRSPLFSGNSEGDQLDRIFQVIGTPPESKWPQSVSLPWSSFGPYTPTPLSQLVPEAGPLGREVLQNMLTFSPLDRIGAASALQHPFFHQEDHPDPKCSHGGVPANQNQFLESQGCMSSSVKDSPLPSSSNASHMMIHGHRTK